MRRTVPAAFLALSLGLTAACGDGGSGTKADSSTKGPITIWLSNNKEELAWGNAMVEAWNGQHADQKITAQEIPAGKSSEEVIGAAITAGNAPCLIFNTAPAAVPQFQKQGGLVALDDFDGAKGHLEQRTGSAAEQYRSPDGKYYQMPWKANPVMIVYNKAVMQKAGVDPENPPLGTYAEFLDTSRKIKSSGAAQAAIYPSPASQFFQSWFDFYPLFIAETGGKQLVEDGKAQFSSAEGQRVADFWKTLYAEGLVPKEQYNGDAFGEGKSAMAIVGPWAISVYGDKIKWGLKPVPTSAGKPAAEIKTFSDAKNVAMYSSCQNRGTAWEVLKFATSQEQDGALLKATGQMPLRANLTATYPDFFAEKPAYRDFADQAGRTVEVSNVPNSITIWQTFRDAYSESVIFGKRPVADAFGDAAKKVDGLAGQR
ncbi:multiple sugar transport system substrate-binding protein [Micromonospora sp. A200]|uniref:extracellular solute-binding protein n=1 Tax=Micromonospora sp. A200 TaxID=2940568 RepID=UPI0024771FED|nr:extracellular solute-binding protein [Micromonospora sp. A200]MDH6464338.1 multiple sugar transport system substrate-binding protein [Micromonospora sp. A200]